MERGPGRSDSLTIHENSMAQKVVGQLERMGNVWVEENSHSCHCGSSNTGLTTVGICVFCPGGRCNVNPEGGDVGDHHQ